jgi:hypothetical protein
MTGAGSWRLHFLEQVAYLCEENGILVMDPEKGVRDDKSALCRGLEPEKNLTHSPLSYMPTG